MAKKKASGKKGSKGSKGAKGAKKEKALDKMTAAELAKKAKAVGAVLTQDMDRAEVETAVTEAMASGGDAQVTVDDKKGVATRTKRPANAPKGMVLVRNMIPKGSCKIFGKKWSGMQQRHVPQAEADDLMSRFPKRFSIITEKKK